MSLQASRISVGYDRRLVVDGLDLDLPMGEITALIGPNACGKSTLLGALGRVLPVRGGVVLLDGADIHRLPTREVARRLGVLPQSPVAPEGITVAELVSRGRHPHQGLLARRTAHDDEVVATAMLRTGVADLAARPVDELSGGQRQRVWIAMALAQETSLLLLDEPTSYLDIAHQIEVLDLLVDLNRDQGTTVVMVLHDLNHAARYASTVVAVKDGAVVASGPPREVVTAEVVEHVFGVTARVIPDPDTGAPLVLARGRHDVPRANDQHRKHDRPDVATTLQPVPLLAGLSTRTDTKDDS
ncbi:ABC transporter ATP-binding protein [Cellulomonas sp. Leaf334]|uniref:ABC transporter ATP-binding protein n=1 Tax=Cellulomonas sp. Leaf334 TaxID=1736339 RepID=UPI0009E68C61|nr:ABC transporter ATP-binding protein [Cellulomonas sp. Leaf334]